MSAIQFTVYWTASDSAFFELDDERLIDDVKREIIETAGVADQTDDGNEIEYTLYRKNHDLFEPINNGRRPLFRIGIKVGERLYLADRKQPWWHAEETRRLDRQPQRERQVGDSRQTVEVILACQIHLSRGCIINVPANGLILNREYLMKILPSRAITLERVKSFFNGSTRLSRVSRDRHCEIFFEHAQWQLCAFKPTYVNGRMRDNKALVILESSTRIILGHEGWPMDIRILPQGQ